MVYNLNSHTIMGKSFAPFSLRGETIRNVISIRSNVLYLKRTNNNASCACHNEGLSSVHLKQVALLLVQMTFQIGSSPNKNCAEQFSMIVNFFAFLYQKKKSILRVEIYEHFQISVFSTLSEFKVY